MSDVLPSIDEHLVARLRHLATVFHAQATVLIGLSSVLQPVIKALGPDPFPFGTEPSVAQVTQFLRPVVSRLNKASGALTESTAPNWRDREIEEQVWQEWTDLREKTEAFLARIETREDAFLPHAFRLLASAILTLVPRLGNINRDNSREVMRAAQEVERLVCLYDLRRAQAQITEMDYELRAVRDEVTTLDQSEEPPQTLIIWNLFAAELNALKNLAQAHEIDLRTKTSKQALVFKRKAIDRDLRRAFRSLIHNAIKYNTPLPSSETWIDISADCLNDSLVIKIESWGVPIKRQELEQGLIFQFGYRGELAKIKKQTGTGIGLTDAMKVIRNHGGSIDIQSRPSRSVPPDREYDIPFITTVTVSLPASSELES